MVATKTIPLIRLTTSILNIWLCIRWDCNLLFKDNQDHIINFVKEMTSSSSRRLLISIKERASDDVHLQTCCSSNEKRKCLEFDDDLKYIIDDFPETTHNNEYWTNTDTNKTHDTPDQELANIDLEQSLLNSFYSTKLGIKKLAPSNSDFAYDCLYDKTLANDKHFSDNDNTILENLFDSLINKETTNVMINNEYDRQDLKVNKIISKGFSESFGENKAIEETSFPTTHVCLPSLEVVINNQHTAEKISEQQTVQEDEERKCINRQECASTNHYDYSKMNDEEVLALTTLPKRQTNISFPKTLHMILERSELDGYSSIICWASHGRAFKILDNNLFLAEVMPKYFYQTKMSSFIRQLSTYGFHKIVGKQNKDVNCFWHNLLLRGRPRLCVGIFRKPKRLLIDHNVICAKVFH